jgi:hypothetical protein
MAAVMNKWSAYGLCNCMMYGDLMARFKSVKVSFNEIITVQSQRGIINI